MTDQVQNSNQQEQTKASPEQGSTATSEKSAEATPSSTEADDLTALDTADEGDLTTPEKTEGKEGEGEAKEAKPDPYADFRGPPENGEYGDYTLPDGAVADPAMKAEFDPIVRKLGLSQAGAQELVNFKAKLDQFQMQQWNEYQASIAAAARKDPEIGGVKFKDSMAAGRQVVAKFGNDDFRQMLKNAGIASHPEMIRFLSKVAKATGETPALGEGGGAVPEKKPLYELMYGPASKE